MNKLTLIFIFFLLLIASCAPAKKAVGGTCTSNDMCKNFKCRNGYCDFSEDSEFCTESGDCKGNLICKESKCIKTGLFCEFRDISGVLKGIGFIMLLILILGSIIPLPTAAFGASITHGGTRVVGFVLIMAIFLAMGFYLSGSCF